MGLYPTKIKFHDEGLYYTKKISAEKGKGNQKNNYYICELFHNLPIEIFGIQHNIGSAVMTAEKIREPEIS